MSFDNTPADARPIADEIKAPVRVCLTANVDIATLSNGDTQDGVLLQTGDRALLVGQTNEWENGIYSVSVASSTRSEDANAVEQFAAPFAVDVMEGSHRGERWRLTNPIVELDVDFIEFSNSGITPTPRTPGLSAPFDNTPPDPKTI